MKKLKEAREIYHFKNVWTSDGKILFKDQGIQVCFKINPDLVGNGQGLHYGKINTFYFLMLFSGLCLNQRVCLLFSHFSFFSIS